MKNWLQLLLHCVFVVTAATGCSNSSQNPSDKGGPRLSIEVSGVHAGLGAAASPMYQPASVTDPDNHEYLGIGVSYGNAVVDSLKIWLTGISASVGEGLPFELRSVSLVSWNEEPREIEIGEGFSGSVTSGLLSIEPGVYSSLAVSYLAKYAITAWAYLDRDNDAIVDTTVWTTSAGVVTADAVLSPENFENYGALTLSVSSPGQGQDIVEPDLNTGRFTVLPAAITVTEDASTVDLKIMLDSFRTVRVWDGRFGEAVSTVIGDGSVPPAGSLFPNNVSDSRTVGSNGGYTLQQLFPPGEFHFGLGYLPTFAFLQGQANTFARYILSLDPEFLPGSLQPLTLVLDGEGVPLLGQAGINDGSNSPNVGQTFRLAATNTNGTWKLATGDGEPTADGIDDGGLNYNNDPNAARIYVDQFPNLAPGESGEVLLVDGPRCDGGDIFPNHCHYGDGVVAYIYRAY